MREYELASFTGSLENLRRVCIAHDAMVSSREAVEAELAIAERDVLIPRGAAAPRASDDLAAGDERAWQGRELRRSRWQSRIASARMRSSRTESRCSSNTTAGGAISWLSQRQLSVSWFPTAIRPVHFATAEAIGTCTHRILEPLSSQATSIVPLIARERVGVLVLGYDR